MNNYYVAFFTLLISIMLFLYTNSALANYEKFDGSPCNKTCGSIDSCLVGGSPICGWTDCELDVPGHPGGCAVFGVFCCIS